MLHWAIVRNRLNAKPDSLPDQPEHEQDERMRIMSSIDVMFSSEFSAATAEEVSALSVARDAIARWTGGVRPSAELPRNMSRVSPQARWLERTQRDLDQWIARGGFAQGEGAAAPLPPLMRPVMYAPPATAPAVARACAD